MIPVAIYRTFHTKIHLPIDVYTRALRSDDTLDPEIVAKWLDANTRWPNPLDMIEEPAELEIASLAE
jgi:hypothetical protein